VAGQMLTQHTEVLAVARTVAVGSTIGADDLVTANVTSDPHLSPIPASQRERIVGMVAQVALSPGQLLTRSQVGPGTGFTRGQMLVALAPSAHLLETCAVVTFSDTEVRRAESEGGTAHSSGFPVPDASYARAACSSALASRSSSLRT
jgi:hypothetical protein